MKDGPSDFTGGPVHLMRTLISKSAQSLCTYCFLAYVTVGSNKCPASTTVMYIHRSSQCTFTQLPDLLLVHVHPLIIDVGSEEILEAVLDICPRCCHGDPLTHRVLLQILYDLRTLLWVCGDYVNSVMLEYHHYQLSHKTCLWGNTNRL